MTTQETKGFAADDCAKNGRTLYTTFAETPMDAARQLFDARPKCKVASICDAKLVGELVIKRHTNIHWINRRDVDAKSYFITSNGKRYVFSDLSAAQKVAADIHAKTGIIVGIGASKC